MPCPSFVPKKGATAGGQCKPTVHPYSDALCNNGMQQRLQGIPLVFSVSVRNCRDFRLICGWTQGGTVNFASVLLFHFRSATARFSRRGDRGVGFWSPTDARFVTSMDSSAVWPCRALRTRHGPPHFDIWVPNCTGFKSPLTSPPSRTLIRLRRVKVGFAVRVRVLLPSPSVLPSFTNCSGVNGLFPWSSVYINGRRLKRRIPYPPHPLPLLGSKLPLSVPCVLLPSTCI